MICKNCGGVDGYQEDMFNSDRKVCDICGCDEWVDFVRSKVITGEKREVKIPLIIPPFEVISKGKLFKIGKIGKVYTALENCDILINETRQPVFNEKNILDETTKRENIHLMGGSLTKIETKWIYNNTEVVK